MHGTERSLAECDGQHGSLGVVDLASDVLAFSTHDLLTVLLYSQQQTADRLRLAVLFCSPDLPRARALILDAYLNSDL